MKKCVNPACAVEFQPKNNRQRFCDDECRLRAYKTQSSYKGLATNTVGAMQELRVAADLLAKGYEVFRAVSPACSTDLVIQKDGILLRIEVRTGYYLPKGIQFAQDSFKSDHFAVALPDQIIYRPPLGD